MRNHLLWKSLPYFRALIYRRWIYLRDSFSALPSSSSTTVLKWGWGRVCPQETLAMSRDNLDHYNWRGCWLQVREAVSHQNISGAWSPAPFSNTLKLSVLFQVWMPKKLHRYHRPAFTVFYLALMTEEHVPSCLSPDEGKDVLVASECLRTQGTAFCTKWGCVSVQHHGFPGGG